MTDQEFQRILREESNSVDWKAGGDPEKIVKTLAAFANDYEGAGIGFVACGVEELKHEDGSSTPKVVGISAGASRKMRDRIFELCHSLVAPPISPQFDSVSLAEDKQVLVVWISASSEVHSFKRTIVVRQGDKVTNATVISAFGTGSKKSSPRLAGPAVSGRFSGRHRFLRPRGDFEGAKADWWGTRVS